MQLILDAEDIDIKRNMSTIERESLSEKFLANKIIEHLADDICSGNKENIQERNNVVPEPAEDVKDSEKNSNTKDDVTVTNNLNGESPKQNIAPGVTENSGDNEINSSEIDPDTEYEQISKNVNKKIPQSDESVSKNTDGNSVEAAEKENNSCTKTVENLDDVETESAAVQNAEDNVIIDNDERDSSSSATKELNSITLDKTTEENDILEEIESDDPIVLNCYAINNGSPTKKADVSDHADEKERLIVNETDKTVEINNAVNNEIIKVNEIDSSVNSNIATDDKSVIEKDTGSLSSSNDTVVDDTSSMKKEIISTENLELITVEDNKIDEGSNKPVDKGLKEVSNQIEVSNMETFKSKEINCIEKITDVNSKATESNTTIEIDDEDVKTVEDNCDSSTEIQELDEELLEKDEKNLADCKAVQKNKIENPSVVSPEPKRICKLSNNLDIFSDEEEEDSPKPNEVEPSIKNTTASTEKESISIEDDDEIMVIDEESNAKANATNESKTNSDKIEPPSNTTTTNEEVRREYTQDNKAADDSTASVKDTSAAQEIPKETTENPNTEFRKSAGKIAETEQKVKKPLLPKNFIRSYKKNLADMTRDELEEFCILKIVESIVDRSNLGEIKSQLKNLTQTMEDCKKKCLMLSKQNKDLQVVLKSVQEDQKSTSDHHITPLKITRSVGMQVVMMVDKNSIRKKPTNSVSSPSSAVANPANNKVSKTPLPSTNSKSERKANNPQIPVPRLVPAVPAAKTNQSPVTNNSPKQVSNNPIPNGLRAVAPVPLAKAAEKRSRSQSVTVDLTDDEPPAKQQTVQRSIVSQGARVATPQQSNVMTGPRFTQTVNSPRKVYIPISGQAQNLRPAQTIMLKPVQGLHARQRCPPTHAGKVPQTSTPGRPGRPSNQWHPAPLPEAPKQYQPSNWKMLPPAPDLKLSKVENGIVISWKIDNYQEDNHETIVSYQLYAYQETQSPPSTSLWKKIGDVKALPLPMACTLTQFMAGYKYYFAVRAVDVRSRFGPFSLPGSILLLNKM